MILDTIRFRDLSVDRNGKLNAPMYLVYCHQRYTTILLLIETPS